jgi:hypothetical protein
MLGGVALIGVIVNDSLVMVSHLNYLKQKVSTTTPVFEWVVRGAKERLRAVVLTTLTTLAGVLTLAYGIGGSAFLLQPMAFSFEELNNSTNNKNIAKTAIMNAFSKLFIDFCVSFAPPSFRIRTSGYKTLAFSCTNACLLPPCDLLTCPSTLPLPSPEPCPSK